VKIEYKRVDKRGILLQIATGQFKQANIIHIKTGETVGGHYHKNRTELFYVIEGMVAFIEEHKFLKNEDEEVLEIKPLMKHTFTGCMDSIILELLSEPFDEKDTWK
jgi:mannose-6-phosphate isomerase-like protein (cupin superfamily)